MLALKLGRAARLQPAGSSGLFPGLLAAASGRHVQLSESVHGQAAVQAEDMAVIRVPRHLTRRVENVKQTRSQKQISSIRAGKLLIQSKNPSLNQSAGFVLGKFEQPVLSSKGWRHRKSFGDFFTINNTKDAAPFMVLEDQDGAAATFKDLRVCQELGDTLEAMGVTRPTTVQLQTIPKVMRGHNVLCAAETGSGKTLSYLVPVVQRLQADRTPQDPPCLRTLVLVPSRELAEQIAAVCRTLCAPFGLHTRTVGGGRGVGHIKEVFQDHADVLVATPGALLKALRRNYVDLSALSFLVVDEADTMFDPSFSDLLQGVLQNVSVANHPRETRGLDRRAQLLLVGATFPGDVGEVLAQVTDLGAMVTVKSRMLHHIMPHVKQSFLKVKTSEKVLELHRALKELPGGAAVVFCNKSPTVNWLSYTFNQMGVQHARLQGAMPAVVRAGIFRSFQQSETDVLVCTDIASRGLDTSRVRLIVNYDFPESLTDYIHRAGRVGRAGGVGGAEVLSFVTHPWDVERVQNLETAARRRTALPGMRSEIQEAKPRPVQPEEDRDKV